MTSDKATSPHKNLTSDPLPQTGHPDASTLLSDCDYAGGVYVHIPFCQQKCAYCDFYSITDARLHRPFVDALKQELLLFSDPPLPADSLYLGGGTPSVLAAPLLNDLLSELLARLDLLPSSEITIEVNPGTVSQQTLQQYRSKGINRISIGVQSFWERQLALLGRRHTAAQTIEAIVAARNAGFDNLGLDLIYALPGQSKAQWLADLKKAVQFEPEHISCYMLAFEPGTPLDKQQKRGKIQPLADHKSAALFKATTVFLTEHGYEHYEVSNFARIDQQRPQCYRSRHNQKYWSGAPYLGLGPSAHSFRNGVRHWNVRSVTGYIKHLMAQRSPVAEHETLTRRQQMIEALYLSLRQAEGLAFRQFEQRFHTNLYERCIPLARALEAEGLLTQTPGHWALTVEGMILADGIVQQFVERIE